MSSDGEYLGYQNPITNTMIGMNDEKENGSAGTRTAARETWSETALGSKDIPGALSIKPGHAAVAHGTTRAVALHYGPGCTGSVSVICGSAVQTKDLQATMDGEDLI